MVNYGIILTNKPEFVNDFFYLGIKLGHNLAKHFPVPYSKITRISEHNRRILGRKRGSGREGERKSKGGEGNV